MTSEQFNVLLAMVGDAGNGAFVLSLIYLFTAYFRGLILLGVLGLAFVQIKKIVGIVSFGGRCAKAIGRHAVKNLSFQEIERMLALLHDNQVDIKK